MTAPLTPCRWPHLDFTDGGQNRFDEVVAFLDTLDAEDHPLHGEIAEDLVKKLDYLDAYGGSVSEADDRSWYRVQLGRDWAAHSFSLTWKRLDVVTGTYRYAFNGGLIWHGGPGDPLSVTVTPQWFGIHT